MPDDDDDEEEEEEGAPKRRRPAFLTRETIPSSVALPPSFRRRPELPLGVQVQPLGQSGWGKLAVQTWHGVCMGGLPMYAGSAHMHPGDPDPLPTQGRGAEVHGHWPTWQ